jgi:nucleotide-binding universal stress UspA family protein
MRPRLSKEAHKKWRMFANRCEARQRGQVDVMAMKAPTIRNILVPIDFSNMSTEAVKTAVRLGRRFTASIHLAHVRPLEYAAGFSAPAPPLVPFSFPVYEQNGEQEILEELNALAREHSVLPMTCHVLGGGSPFDEICLLAQKIPVDLILMPTHGRTGLKHVVLGSTAERVVRHSPCPVLVVRERTAQSKTASRLTVKKILVPVDFSECSREGLRYAIRFANHFRAKIILLHATYLGYIYSSEGTALYDVRGLQKAARENSQRQMRKFIRGAKFGSVKYETAFTDGSPGLDICAFAKSHNIDLIITSTHGRTGLKHVLIGSVAEQVVRRATCSVLVVPSHPQNRIANLQKNRIESLSKNAVAARQRRRPITPVANR